MKKVLNLDLKFLSVSHVFFLFLTVWIQIQILNTNHQSSWIRDPQHWLQVLNVKNNNFFILWEEQQNHIDWLRLHIWLLICISLSSAERLRQSISNPSQWLGQMISVYLEDGSLGILVDGHNHLAVLHTGWKQTPPITLSANPKQTMKKSKIGLSLPCCGSSLDCFF